MPCSEGCGARAVIAPGRVESTEESGEGALEILTGRIYDPTPQEALRVLVDRLWPRGVRKDGCPWDVWRKEAAPSNDLRIWYHAHPEAHEEFRRLYLAELATPEGRAALEGLALMGRERPLALVTARREVARSHVPVLRDAILARLDA